MSIAKTTHDTASLYKIQTHKYIYTTNLQLGIDMPSNGHGELGLHLGKQHLQPLDHADHLNHRRLFVGLVVEFGRLEP